MTKEFRIEHDLSTGQVIEIELTVEEKKELASARIKVEAELKAEAEKALAKSVLFAKLGITNDEAKLLLS